MKLKYAKCGVHMELLFADALVEMLYSCGEMYTLAMLNFSMFLAVSYTHLTLPTILRV